VAIHRLPYTYFRVPPTPAFPEGRSSPKPIIKLLLSNGTRELFCHALVDSGAEDCIFPYSFVRELGLDLSAAILEKSAGLGSSGIPTYFTRVNIAFRGIAEFPVFAGFTTGLERAGFGLLGQSGFFDRFRNSVSPRNTGPSKFPSRVSKSFFLSLPRHSL
jgi:hypothetical protein